MSIWLLLVGLAAFGIACVLTEAVRRVALARGIVDVPNGRSLHDDPRPRGGGAAFVVAVPLAALVGNIMGGIPVGPGYWFAIGLATLLALAGTVDDIRDVGPGPRLVIQVAAAIALIAAVGGIDAIVLPGLSGPVRLDVGPRTGALVSVVAVVGFNNAFNFMDGIDGIAAAQAMVGATLVAILMPDPGGAMVAAAIAGGAGGFLVHNRPRARVFMGDTGSQYLGFLFGGIAVVGDRTSTLPASLVSLAFLPFVVDVAVTLVRRRVRGAPWFQPHREHAYQQMVMAGWSHARTAALYTALGLASALGVFVVVRTGGLGWLWWILAAPTFFLVGGRRSSRPR